MSVLILVAGKAIHAKLTSLPVGGPILPRATRGATWYPCSQLSMACGKAMRPNESLKT